MLSIKGGKMATKKKATKKTIESTPVALSSQVNWIPYCIPIEHAADSKVPLQLSVSANRFPNSV
jgi:hypothetical protein